MKTKEELTRRFVLTLVPLVHVVVAQVGVGQMGSNQPVRVGIVGLNTSHVIELARHFIMAPKAHGSRTAMDWPGCFPGSRATLQLDFLCWAPYFSKLLNAL